MMLEKMRVVGGKWKSGRAFEKIQTASVNFKLEKPRARLADLRVAEAWTLQLKSRARLRGFPSELQPCQLHDFEKYQHHGLPQTAKKEERGYI